ncbi:MAG TPA: cytochrome c [Alphaproteobacteria bacterium]|nr:cytochrome c [Alphaproteobacteria bacterium]
MKRVGRSAVVALTVVAALSATSVAQSAADTYKAKCASCHAADGTGNTPIGKKLAVKDLNAGEEAKRSDEEFFNATKKGKGKMPAYENKISDDDIKALVKYIRSMGKRK